MKLPKGMKKLKPQRLKYTIDPPPPRVFTFRGFLDEIDGAPSEDKPAIIRRIAAELGDLTAEKNTAYGDSFYVSGEILALLYPNGVQPAQYGDMLAAARIIDKLGRLATRKDAFGESPYRDIAGYGLIGAVADEVAKGIRA